MNWKAKRFRLKNRRVAAGRLENGGIGISFIRIKEKDEDIQPTVIRGRVSETSISLTPAAAVALYALLGEILTLKDYAEFEKDLSKHHFKTDNNELEANQ